ncbi:MAG: hypothetical protein HZA11_10900 [Nitrospirae bacterium]|nr:hypothetical protein [Nitrospirota bacterium]
MKIRLMFKIFLLLIAISILSGCATNQSFIMPNKDFKQYKAAYVEIISPDQFNLGPAIIYELSDMGLQVINKPAPSSPLLTDMKVKYSYTQAWDLSPYLYSFQIVFADAQTDAVVANIVYRLSGQWVRSNARITDAFNEFREKLGLPESKRNK